MAPEIPGGVRKSPTAIDTEAHWTKSGWHGPFSGWERGLITVVAGVGIPRAAELTAASADDSAEAGKLLVRDKAPLLSAIRFMLGD